jgi:hypothetical protein
MTSTSGYAGHGVRSSANAASATANAAMPVRMILALERGARKVPIDTAPSTAPRPKQAYSRP